MQQEQVGQGNVCLVYDHSQELVPYNQAWGWQRAELERSVVDLDAGTSPSDKLFILQHAPVYTLGTGSDMAHLRFDPAQQSAIPLYRTERGGEVTYHGPGQLVLYPLLHLARHRQDLHWYMRSLEEVVVRALAEVSGLQGERIPGLTGVWVGGSKVAAIGVRAKRWVTYHGVAINVCPDLSPFADIVPCGIADRPVSSVAQLMGMPALPVSGGVPTPEQAALLAEYRYALLDAFACVFGAQLVPSQRAGS